MPEEHKRQRVSKACEQCRKKKVKCDGLQPICNNCLVLNLPCTYKETTKKRGPPKGYIEAIEGRLHRLEALLGSIIQEDDPRSKAILDELNAPLETAYGELVRPRSVQKEEDTQPQPPPPHLIVKPEPEDSTPDDANDNLGNLSIDEGGQIRYYGKSSGFYLLKNSKNFKDGLFHFNSTQKPSSLLSVDPYELPPPDLSQHLLDLYFVHFYPLFPLLHKRSFLASLDRTPPLLLNSIYAVASRISPDTRVRSDPTDPDTAGDLFFERARLLLDREWDDYKVYTVQSLLLLSSHQNGALKNIRGWLYSGLAFRMSQNLGLNRNCDSWNLTDAEKEERKRVFFCCYVVDRLTCAMHGRAPTVDDRDMDTPYPSEIDDDDKGNKPTKMEEFHQFIKLCEILGDVLQQLYMVKGRKKLAQMSSPDNVISKLDHALNKWMAKLPSYLQYQPPNTRMAEKAPAPRLEICQIHMLFYTSLILLHRPFIPGPTQKGSPSVFPSASICTFAANKILDIVECLMSEGRLKNINNYSLYYMFTAGIIFINDALSSDTMFAFEAKISINKIIRAMDEVEKTWITSARHCNILAELAGLRDINLENIDEAHYKKSASAITMPNSPVNHPIDMGRTNKLPEYLAQQFSPYTNSAQSTPNINTTPSISVNNNSEEPFDPIGTAFWGVPMSFDIDEWNNYLGEQQQSNYNNASYQQQNNYNPQNMW